MFARYEYQARAMVKKDDYNLVTRRLFGGWASASWEIAHRMDGWMDGCNLVRPSSEGIWSGLGASIDIVGAA